MPLLYTLEVCQEPLNTPNEFEYVIESNDPLQIIQCYEMFSHSYRCGKVFRVVMDGFVEPETINEFIRDNDEAVADLHVEVYGDDGGDFRPILETLKGQW